MSSIQVRSSTEATTQNGTPQTSISVPVPSGINTSDLIIVSLSIRTLAGSAPGPLVQVSQPQFDQGFLEVPPQSVIFDAATGITTLLLYAPQTNVAIDRNTALPPTEYTFVFSSAGFAQVSAIAFSGVDSAEPFVGGASTGIVTPDADNPEIFTVTFNHPPANTVDLVFNTLSAPPVTIFFAGDESYQNQIFPNDPDVQFSETLPSASGYTRLLEDQAPAVVPTPTVYNSLNFDSTISANQQPQGLTVTLQSILSCLAHNTAVTMADGSTKHISAIKRGDSVYGNASGTVINKVARVNKTEMRSNYKPCLVKIQKDTFGQGLPNRELLITGPHPLILDGVRRPACCYERFKGVKWYMCNEPAINILPKDNDGTYSVYDLVFDHDGDYIANGVTVQAHSPYHPYDPLPKELYYDVKNYKSIVSYDCLNHKLPYDHKTIVDPASFVLKQ